MWGFLLSFILGVYGWSENPPVFRLSLLSEPTSLSIYQQKSSSASYLMAQIHSPLLWYRNQKLLPRLANCSSENPKKIICQFLPTAKFSNGESILPTHFVKMAEEFLNPKNPGLRADLLLNIQNAEKVLTGKLPPAKLGLKIKDRTLTIQLEKADSDFIYNLANPILSPQFHSRASFPNDPTKIITSGAYQIEKWEQKSKIHLKANPSFARAEKNPPDVEFRFVSEDSVGLTLYEKGELDFLRRLPTLYLPKYKTRDDFHFIDQFRFDYIGFGKELESKPELRKQITQSLNYEDLQKLFDSRPRPGCIGIPENLYLHPTCYPLKPNLKNTSSSSVRLTYTFSKQGGDDHRRSAEWLQAELKKNLQMNLELESLENKLFIQSLNENPSALFRKGLVPDRPTCLAVLENFLPGAIENYLKINDSKLNALIPKLRKELNSESKRKLCQQGFDLILSKNILIPTGPISFALLAKPEFQNWHLNELNQLDLSELRFQKK